MIIEVYVIQDFQQCFRILQMTLKIICPEDSNVSDYEERNDIEVDEFTAIDWNDIIDT